MPISIRLKKSTVPVLALYAAVLLSVIVAATIVTVVALRISAFGARRERVCSTEHCIDHARRLLSALNVSVDPCQDFHAYVCGGREDYPTISPNDILDHLYGSEVLSVLLKPGLEGNYTPTTTLKALIALEKCADRSSASEGIEDFVKFMADRGILWPPQALQADRSAGLLDICDILIDLAINWRVTLWFDISVEYSEILASFIVSVSEVGTLTWHRMSQLSMLPDDAYASLVRNMSSLLTNGTVVFDDDDIAELRHDDNVIRRAILSLGPSEQLDLTRSLGRVGDVAGVISPLEWIRLLNKHLNADVSVSPRTKILLSYKPYIARLFALLRSLEGERAHNVTGWIFAYVYGWTVTTELDDIASMGTGGMGTYSLCFLSVQEMFGIAPFSASFLRQFSKQERNEVSSILKWTSSVLTDVVVNSRSVTNLTKSMAMTKIQRTVGRHLWPPEPFFHPDTLDAMYDSFPAQQSSFFAIWTKSRKALRTSLKNRYYGSLMTARYRWPLNDVLYVYSLNWIRVSLGALYPPSYLKDGSRAMAYSGLGFRLARALVRTMDEHGRQLDHLGRYSSWWHNVQNCTWDIAKSELEKRGVADLFALEIALDALKRSSASDHQPLKIRGLEIFSEAQTFFVSYCSHFCDDPDGKRLCGVAANISDFASAYACHKPERDNCLFV